MKKNKWAIPEEDVDMSRRHNIKIICRNNITNVVKTISSKRNSIMILMFEYNYEESSCFIVFI